MAIIRKENGKGLYFIIIADLKTVEKIKGIGISSVKGNKDFILGININDVTKRD